MVHDKMREANRFKEYERIPKNRSKMVRNIRLLWFGYMLHTIEDILAKGDKLVLLGFFTVEPKFYKEKKHVLEWKEQAKMCMRFQKDIRQSLNLVLC